MIVEEVDEGIAEEEKDNTMNRNNKYEPPEL